MTLWMAWTVLASALVAIAAIAAERAVAVFDSPRRFVWVAAFFAIAFIPLALALRTPPRVGEPAAVLPAASSTAAPFVMPTRISVRQTVRSVDSGSPASLAPIARQPDSHQVLGIGPTLVRRADRWIVYAWLVSSLALLVAYVSAALRLRHQRARWDEAETQGCRVFVAQDAGPAVIGFLRPRIIIPNWAMSLEREAQRMLLWHELEHIRAGDPRTLMCAGVLLIVFPWNLALWWMIRRLRLAIEIDCDARVIRVVGNARDYGLMLLAVGERYSRHLPLAASFVDPGSNLEARIDAMTASPQRRPLLASLPFALAAFLSLTAAVRAPRPTPLLKSVAKPPSARSLTNASVVVEGSGLGAYMSGGESFATERAPTDSLTAVAHRLGWVPSHRTLSGNWPSIGLDLRTLAPVSTSASGQRPSGWREIDGTAWWGEIASPVGTATSTAPACANAHNTLRLHASDGNVIDAAGGMGAVFGDAFFESGDTISGVHRDTVWSADDGLHIGNRASRALASYAVYVIERGDASRSVPAPASDPIYIVDGVRVPGLILVLSGQDATALPSQCSQAALSTSSAQSRDGRPDVHRIRVTSSHPALVDLWTIVKGSAATEQFGSGAANGVVVITTRR